MTAVESFATMSGAGASACAASPVMDYAYLDALDEKIQVLFAALCDAESVLGAAKKKFENIRDVVEAAWVDHEAATEHEERAKKEGKALQLTELRDEAHAALKVAKMRVEQLKEKLRLADEEKMNFFLAPLEAKLKEALSNYRFVEAAHEATIDAWKALKGQHGEKEAETAMETANAFAKKAERDLLDAKKVVRNFIGIGSHPMLCSCHNCLSRTDLDMTSFYGND